MSRPGSGLRFAIREFASSAVTPDRETTVAVRPQPSLFRKEQVIQKHGKALVIYGAAHFYRSMPEDYLSSLGEDIGLARRLEREYPGRTFVVIPVGGLGRPPAVKADIDPDFQKFDRALKTQVRPVLVSLGAIALPGFHRRGVPWPHVDDRRRRLRERFSEEAVSLSAKWLMRAFMLAGAPTSIRKRSGSRI